VVVHLKMEVENFLSRVLHRMCWVIQIRTAPDAQHEEFQALFHIGAYFQQSPNLPQFEWRTSWGPSSQSQRKLKPYSNSSKGKNPNKKTTFACEVVLLRCPSDSMVWGGAKAELQRLGHIVSSFEFDKLRSANEVQKKTRRGIQKASGETVFWQTSISILRDSIIDSILDNQLK
jgi:hypothetical protein